MKLEEIKEHWNRAGKDFTIKRKSTPTSRDPYLSLLERENILSYLKDVQKCLEIGCGDATHSMYYAERVRELSAIDIAETLVEIAMERIRSLSCCNIELRTGSVLELENMFPEKSFNCVISQRCIINLPEWEYQKEAIMQVHNLLEQGGYFLLTEGFQEELDKLNLMRKELNLSEIKVVPYNKYLSRSDFESFIMKYFEIIEMRDYGLYLFLSRIYHPLVLYPDEPKHDSIFNEAASRIARSFKDPGYNKISYNLFYALRKK